MKILSDLEIAFQIREVAYNLKNMNDKDAKIALRKIADNIEYRDDMQDEDDDEERKIPRLGRHHG